MLKFITLALARQALFVPPTHLFPNMDIWLDDLMEAGRVTLVAYVPGAEAAGRAAPRHNLTGDLYFTDGLRAVAIFSETRTNPTFLNSV